MTKRYGIVEITENPDGQVWTYINLIAEVDHVPPLTSEIIAWLADRLDVRVKDEGVEKWDTFEGDWVLDWRPVEDWLEKLDRYGDQRQYGHRIPPAPDTEENQP